MKALIVIEIPEDHFLVTANDLYERLKGYKCDLKPMPEYNWHEEGKENECEEWYRNGWNDCLDAITGETER